MAAVFGFGIGFQFYKKGLALVGPVATAATSVTVTSFVANWNTYDGATTYYLDVSISSSFSTFVLQNQAVSAPTTSYTVTGLTACTTYYYRVRAQGVVPTISVAPTLSPSGSQVTGTVITCGTGTWNSQGSIFNYKWKRNGVAITGATSNTYTIQAIDDGTTITCDVQNQNGFGKSAYVGTSNSVSATSFVGILDTYPNATIAHSIRKLRSAYSGNAIRVRRSSDNAEQDIGFTSAGDLNTTSLNTFCGANDGFVTTWYDQSGNANDLYQTTASLQPKIYDSITGVILTNGKPAIQYENTGGSGYNLLLLTSSVNSNQTLSNFEVTRRLSSNTIHPVLNGLEGGGGVYTAWNYNDNNVYFATYQGFSFAALNVTAQTILTSIYNIISDNMKVFQNTNSIINATPAGADRPIGYTQLGQRQGAIEAATGTVQENIFYAADKTTDTSGIWTNINTYYAIY
jgi:hypothetical protein